MAPPRRPLQRSSRRLLTRISLFCLIALSANSLKYALFGGTTTTISVETRVGHVEDHNLSYLIPKGPKFKIPGLSKSNKVQTVPIGEHWYNPNGLLEVNPQGQHPIFDLIQKSEAAWQQKLDKASRTLREAVVEYERRYGRKPPLGFDKWWNYVEENHVQLPDEYDQINEDLEAYWGVDPYELQTEPQNQIPGGGVDSYYIIGKLAIEDPIEVLNTSLKFQATYDLTEGGKMVIDMLRRANLEQHIPPFRVNFNPLDNPEMNTEWSLWNEAVTSAKRGRTISTLNYPQLFNPNGWLASCDPTSIVWTKRIDFNSPYPARRGADPMSRPSSRTFIHDHRAAMDPCQHPHLLRQHGQFIKHNRGPAPKTTLSPLISFSPSMLHRDIIAAIPLNWVSDVESDLAWEDKDDERLHWRGANTGTFHSDEFQWRLTHRIKTVGWAQDNLHSNLRLLGLGSKMGEPLSKRTVVKKARWAPSMLDIGFSGRPISCDDATCDELVNMFEWKKYVSPENAGKYKYILDVDGNAWSARFKRLITSSSCIFKATIYPEWFAHRIQPWVHYVPVQVDLSDLWDAFSFFRGDLNGDFGHDDLAEKIGAQGREWSLNFWREEDLVAYNFRLLLEYARVMSTDREAMSFDYWATESGTDSDF